MGSVQRSMPVSGLVRLGAVLAIVLGILGMHALSQHGIAHTESTPRTAIALIGSMSVDADSGHANHFAAAPSAAPDTDTLANDSGGTDGTGHSLGDMVMLCVAMLAAAATMLGLLSLIRRVPRLWALLRPDAANVRPTDWLKPTGTGPPPAWQFSVIRC